MAMGDYDLNEIHKWLTAHKHGNRTYYRITLDLSGESRAKTCDHPMALLQVTDNMAFCDGCGRTFELRKFGGTL